MGHVLYQMFIGTVSDKEAGFVHDVSGS